MLARPHKAPLPPNLTNSAAAPDDADDDDTDKVPVLVTLMQEYRRSQRQFGIKMAQIGFLVYKVSLTPKWPRSGY